MDKRLERLREIVREQEEIIEALEEGRPPGHWVPYKHESCTYGKTNYICSECGHVGTKFKENFCMCCGADMRGEDK